MKRNTWLVVGGLGIVGVCMMCILCLGLYVIIGARTSQPQAVLDDSSGDAPAVANSSAAAFTINGPASYQEIVNTTKTLTEIQRNEYYKTLKGKNVHWTDGTVADVSSSGEIHVRFINTLSYEVRLTSVAVATASNFSLGDKIQFDGTITDVSDILGSGRPNLTIKTVSLKKP